MTLATTAPSATHSAATTSSKARLILDAAALLLPSLAKGEALDARLLRNTMEQVTGASDADGAWCWKDAYEASEAACVLFLRRYGKALHAKSSGDAPKLAALLTRIEALLPSHTKRSEDSVRLQQFSTPIGIGESMARAAQLTPSDSLLEPSAGTGLLAIQAELRGATLVLNELAETRGGILKGLFPSSPLFAFNAEHIDDFLSSEIRPTVVLMNPPFSVSPHVDGASMLAGFRHLSSALARLVPKGRLIALLSDRFDPASSNFAESFQRLTEKSRLVFHATIDGALYQRHGTTTATRLLVLDKQAADEQVIPASAGHATDLPSLFRLVDDGVPPRLEIGASLSQPSLKNTRSEKPVARRSSATGAAIPLSVDGTGGEAVLYQSKTVVDEAAHPTDKLYEPYGVQTIAIDGARPHPTALGTP